jgi:hypothetical protein
MPGVSPGEQQKDTMGERLPSGSSVMSNGRCIWSPARLHRQVKP